MARKPTNKAKKTKEKDIGDKVEMPKIHCMSCGTGNQVQFYATKDSNRSYYSKIPYCKDCIKKIYNNYLKKYDDINLAVYYTCRKIDIVYIHQNFVGAMENINNPNAKIQGEDAIIPAYIKGLSFSDRNGWGATFDDSQGEGLIEKLHLYDAVIAIKRKKLQETSLNDNEAYETVEYDRDILRHKWGATLENWELEYLEGEYLDWADKLNEKDDISDKTIDTLVRQICQICLDIQKGRQNSQPVDKQTKTLQELLNNTGLMEKQNKVSNQKKNVGMSIAEIERVRPIAQKEKLFEDVDDCKEIIFGLAGCISKAVGKENSYTTFFDEWMKEYSIDIIDEMTEQKKSEVKALVIEDKTKGDNGG